MPTCPHSGHSKPVEIKVQTSRFAHCDECRQTSVLCTANCGTFNHPFARYCRKCKQPVRWIDEENRWKGNLKLSSDLRDRSFSSSVDLSPEARTKRLRVLIPYQGYILTGLDQAGVAIRSSTSMENSVSRFFQGENVVNVATSSKMSQNLQGSIPSPPYLIVTTEQVVYRVSVLPTFQSQEVYRSNVKLAWPAFLFSSGIGVVEDSEEGLSIRVLSDDGKEIRRDFLPLSDYRLALHCTQLDFDRLFFFSRRQYVLYSSSGIVDKGETPFEINERVEPSWHLGRRQLYVGGKQSLLRIDFQADHPNFFRLGTESFSVCQLGVNPDGDEVYVAHSEGVSILNSFSGQEKWTARSLLGPKAECGVFAPQQVGSYLVFGFINQQRGHDICFINFPERNDVMRVRLGGQQLSCPPIFTAGHMIVGVNNKNQVLVQSLRI